MCRTKDFDVVAVLLALALMLGSISLACGTTPTTPPAPPELGMPANYTTYTDRSGLFRISYPADWEGGRWQYGEWGEIKGAKEGISRLQSGLPVEYHHTIFYGKNSVQDEMHAYMFISLEPVFEGKPCFYFDNKVERTRMTYDDFRELSRITTTVDGREGIIWEWEDTWPEEQVKQYHMELFLPTDKAVWVVSCSANSDNFTMWQNDFNTIVRSLRISVE